MNVANIIEKQVLDLYKTTAYQKLKPNVVRTHLPMPRKQSSRSSRWKLKKFFMKMIRSNKSKTQK